MKVLPAGTPSSALPDAKPAKDAPSGHFADLLTKKTLDNAALAMPLSPGEQRGEVFAFGELGMFGRYGVQTHRMPPVHPAMHMQNAQPAVIAPDRDLPASFTTEKASVASPEYSRPDAPRGGFWNVGGSAPKTAGREASPALYPDNAEYLAENPMRGFENLDSNVSSLENMPEANEKSPPALVEDRLAGSEAAAFLLAAGEANALSIVARSADKSLNANALRRALSDTAAEFGMTVSDLRLNGEKQDFLTMLGGSNGSRTR